METTIMNESGPETAICSIADFKVMIINPPQAFSKFEVAAGISPPLNVMYLGAVCEKKGYNIKCLDSLVEAPEQVTELKPTYCARGLNYDQIVARIDPATHVVGITNLFSVAFPIVLELTKHIRAVYPHIKIVVGGAHPSGTPKETLKHPSIDFVILSEGEDTFIELCESIRTGNYGNLPGMDGIAFRQGEEIVVKPKTKFNQDLDAMPFPARHLLPHNRYSELHEAHGPTQAKYTTMLSSRGCPYRCTFCTPQLWNFSWRIRSAQNVVDEMEFCAKEYGVTEFHFEDENLTIDKRRILEMCDEIKKRGLKVKWQTPNGIRASVTDFEMLKAMKDSGCYHITVAPESGSEHVLKNIVQKTQKLEQVNLVIERASKLGINVAAYMMLGLPGEKKEDVEQSIQYIKHMAKIGLDEFAYAVFTPHPGSALYTKLKAEGKVPQTWEELANVSDMTKAKSWSEFMTNDEVYQLRNRAYREFFFTRLRYHPIKVLKSVFNILRGKETLKGERVILTFIRRTILGKLTYNKLGQKTEPDLAAV